MSEICFVVVGGRPRESRVLGIFSNEKYAKRYAKLTSGIVETRPLNPVPYDPGEDYWKILFCENGPVARRLSRLNEDGTDRPPSAYLHGFRDRPPVWFGYAKNADEATAKAKKTKTVIEKGT